MLLSIHAEYGIYTNPIKLKNITSIPGINKYPPHLEAGDMRVIPLSDIITQNMGYSILFFYLFCYIIVTVHIFYYYLCHIWRGMGDYI